MTWIQILEDETTLIKTWEVTKFGDSDVAH